MKNASSSFTRSRPFLSVSMATFFQRSWRGGGERRRRGRRGMGEAPSFQVSRRWPGRNYLGGVRGQFVFLSFFLPSFFSVVVVVIVVVVVFNTGKYLWTWGGGYAEARISSKYFTHGGWLADVRGVWFVDLLSRTRADTLFARMCLVKWKLQISPVVGSLTLLSKTTYDARYVVRIFRRFCETTREKSEILDEKDETTTSSMKFEAILLQLLYTNRIIV